MQQVTLIQEVNDVPMINTKNLADMFEREHSHVMRSLRGLIDEGFISLDDFVASDYVNTRGQTQPCYAMTEKAALIAMPFIGGKKSKEGQVKLVNEFIQYRERAQTAVPAVLSPTQLAMLVIESEKAKALLEVKVELQEIKIEADSPKVDFYDDVVADTETLHTMSEAAKLIGWGPRKMNKELREAGWLFKTLSRVEPKQRYIESGYFVYKLVNRYEEPSTYVLHETYKTHVTGKGLAAIKNLLKW
jgi:Rha family phage regulatory protein